MLSIPPLDDTNHQALPCRFHHFPGDSRQGIDLHQACDLRQQAMYNRKLPPVIRMKGYLHQNRMTHMSA
jgi:hypothetical protein